MEYYNFSSHQSFLEMAYTKPQYSRKKVNESGAILINPPSPLEYNDALKVIDNWRTSHNFPLNTFQVWLRRNARLVDPECLVAQRIKRFSSIKLKLSRMKDLKLSEMQDIGGCRAIVDDVNSVNKLLELYKKSDMRHKFEYKDDYISEPKRKSGYRGVHLIYSYVSDRNKTYNGHRIEIQLRTRLQHAWATAVETVGTFTSQVLKASQGDKRWLRFFKLIATAMAKQEGTSPVLNTPVDEKELLVELHTFNDKITELKRIQKYGEAIHTVLAENPTKVHYFLITLDPIAKTVNVRGFSSKDIKMASDEYLKIEKSIVQDKTTKDAVLVSTESMESLESAYPNYFLDMKVFVDIVEKIIHR